MFVEGSWFKLEGFGFGPGVGVLGLKSYILKERNPFTDLHTSAGRPGSKCSLNNRLTYPFSPPRRGLHMEPRVGPASLRKKLGKATFSGLSPSKKSTPNMLYLYVVHSKNCFLEAILALHEAEHWTFLGHRNPSLGKWFFNSSTL